ncbi:hypothetical protein ACLOJK_005802 [Asimina triloba]
MYHSTRASSLILLSSIPLSVTLPHPLAISLDCKFNAPKNNTCRTRARKKQNDRAKSRDSSSHPKEAAENQEAESVVNSRESYFGTVIGSAEEDMGERGTENTSIRRINREQKKNLVNVGLERRGEEGCSHGFDVSELASDHEEEEDEDDEDGDLVDVSAEEFRLQEFMKKLPASDCSSCDVSDFFCACCCAAIENRKGHGDHWPF